MFLSEWFEFPSAPCLAGKKKTWWQLASRCCWNRARLWHASELVSLLVGLRTYQHPGTYSRFHHKLTSFYFKHTRMICPIYKVVSTISSWHRRSKWLPTTTQISVCFANNTVRFDWTIKSSSAYRLQLPSNITHTKKHTQKNTCFNFFLTLSTELLIDAFIENLFHFRHPSNSALFTNTNYFNETVKFRLTVNPLSAELNPICHLQALLGAHHIFHVSVLRSKLTAY